MVLLAPYGRSAAINFMLKLQQNRKNSLDKIVQMFV